MPGKVPDRIGNYQIVRELGRGGMGVVYLAVDPAINRQIALKMLPNDLVADETTQKRFLREIEFLSTLEHPHIVPTYGMEISDERPFLVMRYLPGGTLRERLAARSLSRPALWQMLYQVAQALDYAHGKGLVHRDVKPTNILFDDSGNAYISDFGIAKAINSNTRLTLTASLTGTPEYMSPEQFQSLTVDGRADQYSLAIILYEALAGKLPFQGDTFQLMYQHVYERPPSIVTATDELSSDLAVVVERALAKDPADRFASVTAFITAAEGASKKTTGRIPTLQDNVPKRITNHVIERVPSLTDSPSDIIPDDPIAKDDFLVKVPVVVVTGAGGKVKSSRFKILRTQHSGPEPRENAGRRQQKKFRTTTWPWLAAVGTLSLFGLLFIISQTNRGQASEAPLELTLVSGATSQPVVAVSSVTIDSEIVTLIQNDIQTDKSWLLTGGDLSTVVTSEDEPMRLRFVGGSELYIPPQTEVSLTRIEDGYLLRINSGKLVLHSFGGATMYVGNRLGSWVRIVEQGTLVGIISRADQSLEFIAHCFVGSCDLKGDLYDTPMQLMAGEAGRVGGSGVPESIGPADYAQFTSLAAIAPIPTIESPTSTATPTVTNEPSATATTRALATKRPANIDPAPLATSTNQPPAPPATPTIAPPTNTPERPRPEPTSTNTPFAPSEEPTVTNTPYVPDSD